MRWLMSMAVVAATAMAAAAAPPKIPGPKLVAPGDIIEVEIEQDAAGEIGFHNPYDPASLYVRDAVPTREKTVCLIIRPYEKQVYRLTVWTASEKTGVTLVVDATGGKPLPVVDPVTPVDPVNPVNPVEPVVPKAKRLAVVVIEETQQRTVAQGRTLMDPTLREWLKSGRHELEILDKDDPAAKRQGFLPFANHIGLPAVLVFDADVTGPQVPLAQYKLPASAAEWKTALEKVVKK